VSENKGINEVWLNGPDETKAVVGTTEVTVRGREDAARLDWLDGEGNFERAWRTFMRSGYDGPVLSARQAIDEERAADARRAVEQGGDGDG
jgi:hypothetical protein